MLDTMNWHENIRSIVALLTFALSALSFAIAAMLRRDGAAKAALKAVESALSERIEEVDGKLGSQVATLTQRLDGVAELTVRMSESIRHLPTQADINGLRHSMSELSMMVAQLRGTGEVNSRLLERMNQFLMERSQ